MKKAIFIGLMLTACMAQANTVVWGNTTVLNSAAGFSSGDLVLLVWSSGGAGLSDVALSDLAAGNGVISDDQVAAKSTVTAGLAVSQSTLMAPNPTYAGPAGYGTAVSWGTGAKANLYIVVFNGATLAASTEVAWKTAGNIANLQNNAINAFITSNGAWTYYTPVPEPTTMSLALIGIGALALRRRFAKK